MSATNCKNCGAPFRDPSRCEYCGTSYFRPAGPPPAKLPMYSHGGPILPPSIDSGYWSTIMLHGAALSLLVMRRR